MRIVQLTVGTGNRYLGSAVRDQALCCALRRMGHQIHFIRLWDDMLVEDEEYWRHDVAFNCKLTLTSHSSWVYRLFGEMLPNTIARTISSKCHKAFNKKSRAERTRTIFEMDESWGDLFWEESDELVKTIDKCNPDVICVSGFPPKRAIEIIRDRVKVPMVLTLNGSLFDLLDSGVAASSLKDAMELADVVVSPSQYLLDEAISSVGPKLKDARVVNTGFMLNFFSARELIPPEPAVGYLGGMDPRNEFDALVDAVFALKERGLAFKFIILSGATVEERAALDRRLATFNDSKCSYRCLQYLPIQDKTQIMEQFSLLCLPGRRKAFGNPVIEAMATGLPVVQPDAGPYKEIIRDGETGVLYDPNDPKALVDALERVLTDRELNKKLSHDARAEAIGRFSSERMVGEMLQIFEELTS